MGNKQICPNCQQFGNFHSNKEDKKKSYTDKCYKNYKQHIKKSLLNQQSIKQNKLICYDCFLKHAICNNLHNNRDCEYATPKSIPCCKSCSNQITKEIKAELYKITRNKQHIECITISCLKCHKRCNFTQQIHSMNYLKYSENFILILNANELEKEHICFTCYTQSPKCHICHYNCATQNGPNCDLCTTFPSSSTHYDIPHYDIPYINTYEAHEKEARRIKDEYNMHVSMDNNMLGTNRSYLW